MTERPLTPAQAAEQALVRRARQGDDDAFRQIVQRYEGLVAATVVGMLGPGTEADEVGQDVFVKLYEALEQYRGEGGLAPYLTRIAVTRSLNAIDKRKRRRRRFLLWEDDQRDVPDHGEHPVFRSERAALVHQALDRLSPDHRTVVVLRMMNGYSTKETAAMLGVPLGTVLSRLARARDALRDLLGPILKDDYGDE